MEFEERSAVVHRSVSWLLNHSRKCGELRMHGSRAVAVKKALDAVFLATLYIPVLLIRLR